MPRKLYLEMGGHASDIVSIHDVLRDVAPAARIDDWHAPNPWPFAPKPRAGQ
jgi:hypothetical protein